jgi:hypothetical protein
MIFIKLIKKRGMSRKVYQLIIFIILISFSLPLYSEIKSSRTQRKDQFIRVSKEDPRYFETTDGKTWIPVMINYIVPYGKKEDETFQMIESYFKNFSENGGNAMRIWISSPFLEIEDEQAGQYNPVKFRRIDRMLQLAQQYGIRIKFTLQHIRSIGLNESWSNSKVLSAEKGGPFNNIREYISTPMGKQYYLNRVKALAERYKNNSQIFCWELWNEMDAVEEVNDNEWLSFSSEMLDSVKALFPHHLVTQTLGSLHSKDAEKRYEKFFLLSNNDFVSLHRYLDPGKAWGQYDKTTLPIDLIVYDAMKFAENFVKDKPIVVNEIGAVEANHTGPSVLYSVDSVGVLIHDMIFAPFFCGAGGPGSLWHWDVYIQRQNLWYHYQRFQNAIKGIDPAKEHFEPFYFTKEGIRCYLLKGKTKTIIWCRDSLNNWRTELLKNIRPVPRNNFSLQINQLRDGDCSSAMAYNPWNDEWDNLRINNGSINIPQFTRSVIVVLE